MRATGKLVGDVLRQVREMVVPGISLLDLDRAAEQLAFDAGAKPAFKNYRGFLHSLCVSVNEQVVHGVPTDRRLVEGDIVGLDFGLVLDGYYGDSAITVPVGLVSQEAVKLIDITQSALAAAIHASRSGNSLKDVAIAIEKVVPAGYGIVRDFTGHGIGQKLHEEPTVANCSQDAVNLILRPGMTIAIEPMINAGSPKVIGLEDRWTVVTEDGSLSAHFEHTILITDGEAEILTKM